MKQERKKHARRNESRVHEKCDLALIHHEVHAERRSRQCRRETLHHAAVSDTCSCDDTKGEERGKNSQEKHARRMEQRVHGTRSHGAKLQRGNESAASLHRAASNECSYENNAKGEEDGDDSKRSICSKEPATHPQKHSDHARSLQASIHQRRRCHNPHPATMQTTIRAIATARRVSEGHGSIRRLTR